MVDLQVEQVRMLFVIAQAVKRSLIERTSSLGHNARLSSHRNAHNLEPSLQPPARGSNNIVSEASRSSVVVNMQKQYYGKILGNKAVSSVEKMLGIVTGQSSSLVKKSDQVKRFEKWCAGASNIVHAPIMLGAAAISKPSLPISPFEFKGGDRLDGLYAHYHHIMMLNELEVGRGAYELRWAGTSKSGPSFGGNQMDIAYNKAGRKHFLSIVRNARNHDGQLFFNESEVQAIEKILHQPKSMVGKKVKEVFGATITKKIQVALGSANGRQLINDAYPEEIISKAQKLEEIIYSLKDGPGKTFAQSTEGKLYIFDYNNQYDLKRGGPLCRYLNGEEVTLESGQKIPRFSENKFTKVNFFYFLTQLEYYKQNSKDVKRRYKNIEEHVEKYVAREQRPSGDNITEVECQDLQRLYIDFVYGQAWQKPAYSKFAESLVNKYNPPSGDMFEKCEELYGIGPYGSQPEKPSGSSWWW